MNPLIPSRRVLRQLDFAWREWAHRSPAISQTRTTCYARQRHRIISGLASRGTQAVANSGRLTLCRNSSSTATANATPESTTPSQTSSPTTPKLPDITNHYTLFPCTLPHGPPPSGSFSIPLPALRKEFLQIQSVHHPDKHPEGPARSKALALSALINNAYKTLSDPLLRAQYLLQQIYGINVMSEDSSTHKTDTATLMEVMDAQERIEEAETEEQIEEIRAENAERIEQTLQALGEALERDDAGAATRECVRLKYWRSLGDGLHSWEPGKEVRLIH